MADRRSELTAQPEASIDAALRITPRDGVDRLINRGLDDGDDAVRLRRRHLARQDDPDHGLISLGRHIGARRRGCDQRRTEQKDPSSHADWLLGSMG
ncbi:MAG TPA: hypothetical protein VNN55_05075 [bacterium]|nr:hypothetical protein [bacterium]